MNLKIAWGLVISIGAGTLVTYCWSWFLYTANASLLPRVSRKNLPLFWTAPAMGILERGLITVMIGWNVPDSALFIAGWLAVKAACNWGAWTAARDKAPAAASVWLLGNVMSILFGVIGGLFIY